MCIDCMVLTYLCNKVKSLLHKKKSTDTRSPSPSNGHTCLLKTSVNFIKYTYLSNIFGMGP